MARRSERTDTYVRAKVADSFIRAKLLELTTYRAVTKIAKGSIRGPKEPVSDKDVPFRELRVGTKR